MASLRLHGQVLLLTICVSVIATHVSNDSSLFCSDAKPNRTHGVVVRLQFVFDSCIYFSEENANRQRKYSNRTVDNRQMWYEYCLSRQALSPRKVSSYQLFKVDHLDVAVQIPVADLSSSLPVFPPGADSVLFIFSKHGRYDRSLIRMTSRSNTSGPGTRHLALNASVVSQLRDHLKGNGTGAQLNFLDGRTSIRSLTYDRRQKRLYVMPSKAGGPDNMLTVLDMATLTWSFVHFEFAVSNVTNRTLNLQKSESIIYVNGRLYLAVVKKLYPLKLTTDNDKTNAIIDGQQSFTWKQFFNCYGDSPLAVLEDESNMTTTMNVTDNFTSGPLVPLRPITDIGAHTVKPEFNYMILVISIVLVVLFCCIGFVACRDWWPRFWEARALAKEKKRDLERLSMLEEMVYSSTSTSKLDTSELDSSTSTDETPRRRRKKSKRLRQTSRSPSTPSSVPSSSPSSSTSRSLLSFFSRKMKKPSKKPNRSPKSARRDYSSRLSKFNRNLINISRSMTTTRTRTSSTSSLDMQSLKIHRQNFKDCHSPPRPILEPPSAEHKASRPLQLGYFVGGAKPGGFRIRTRDPILEQMLNQQEAEVQEPEVEEAQTEDEDQQVDRDH